MLAQVSINKVKITAGGISLALIFIIPSSKFRASAAANGADPNRVLVVYNSNSADSQTVANYYVVKRMVPSNNLLGLNIQAHGWYYYTGEYGNFYTQMVQPIKDKLTALGPTNIDVILLVGDIPTVVQDGCRNTRSLDNALIEINALGSASSSCIPRVTNPYFAPTPTFTADKGHFDHSLYKSSSKDIYMVMRLGIQSNNISGSDFLYGIDQIDQSLYAEKYLYPGSGYYNGNIYIDSRYGDSSGNKYTDSFLATQSAVTSGNYLSYGAGDMNIAYAEHYFLNSGFTVKWENTTNDKLIGNPSAMFSDSTPALTAPRALFYGGWYNGGGYNDVWSWLPGSIGDDLNSYDNFGRQALLHGASASTYVIGEPYLNGIQRPNIWLYYISKGYDLAEALTLSTPDIGWMEVNAGDPLYSPLKAKTAVVDNTPPVLVSGYPQISQDTQTGNVSIKLLLDTSVTPEVATAKVDFGSDSSYGSSVTSGTIYTKSPVVSVPFVPGHSYHYRISVIDPVGNITVTSDAVYNAPALVPYNNIPHNVPGIIQAEDFDNGGQGVAYFDTGTGNSYQGCCGAMIYRNSDVDIEATTDTGGGYDVGQTGCCVYPAPEWISYSINVPTAGTYTFQARVSSQGGGAATGAGGTFRMEIDRNDVTGSMQIPDNTWQTISKSGIFLSAGQHIMRVQMLTAGSEWVSTGHFNYFNFVSESGGTTNLIGDLNNDCSVNSLDWSVMNSKWFSTDPVADLNHDGNVNSLDWSIMNSNWFKMC